MNSNKFSKIKLGFLSARLFGYIEVFILFGIQLFWILYKGDLVYHENNWDLLAIFVVFVIFYLVAIFCRIENFRVIFRQIEWIIHLLVCLCYFLLFLLLQTRDEFNPFIPFTWLFFLWIINSGLILISNLVMNLDKPPLFTYLQKRNKFFIFLGISTVIWLITLGIISIIRYPVYYWIASSIFHAIMIPISISYHYTNSEVLMKGPQIPNSYVVYKNFKEMFSRKANRTQKLKKETSVKLLKRYFKTLFLILLFVLSWNQWCLYNQAMGSIEDNYFLITGIFISPLFYVGVGLAILNIKFKKYLLGDGLVLLIMALSLIEIYFLAPFSLGYSLLMFLFISSDKSPTRYAINLIFIQLAWEISMLLFSFYIMLFGISDLIIIILFGALGFIFIFYLGFFILEKYLKQKNKNDIKMNYLNSQEMRNNQQQLEDKQ